MGSFHNVSYFSVALSVEIQVIHIQKIQLLLSIFFPLIIMNFLCSHSKWKTHVKKGVTVLVSSQNNKKGTISASNDHFAEGDWDEFQTNILLATQSYQDGYKKGIRTTKGAIIASFKATGQNHRHLWSRNSMRPRRCAVPNKGITLTETYPVNLKKTAWKLKYNWVVVIIIFNFYWKSV